MQHIAQHSGHTIQLDRPALAITALQSVWEQACQSGVYSGVPKGKYAGVHVGRAQARATGFFESRTHQGQQGISHRSCKPIHRNDG